MRDRLSSDAGGRPVSPWRTGPFRGTACRARPAAPRRSGPWSRPWSKGRRRNAGAGTGANPAAMPKGAGGVHKRQAGRCRPVSARRGHARPGWLRRRSPCSGPRPGTACRRARSSTGMVPAGPRSGGPSHRCAAGARLLGRCTATGLRTGATGPREAQRLQQGHGSRRTSPIPAPGLSRMTRLGTGSAGRPTGSPGHDRARNDSLVSAGGLRLAISEGLVRREERDHQCAGPALRSRRTSPDSTR